jgi:hypothetical protein
MRRNPKRLCALRRSHVLVYVTIQFIHYGRFERDGEVPDFGFEGDSTTCGGDVSIRHSNQCG